MKTRFLKEVADARHAVVLSVVVLSACATVPQEGAPTQSQPAHRQGVAAPQKSAPVPAQQQVPAPTQQPAVPAQQPVPAGQVTPSPAKSKHNVEED